MDVIQVDELLQGSQIDHLMTFCSRYPGLNQHVFFSKPILSFKPQEHDLGLPYLC